MLEGSGVQGLRGLGIEGFTGLGVPRFRGLKDTTLFKYLPSALLKRAHV